MEKGDEAQNGKGKGNRWRERISEKNDNLFIYLCNAGCPS